MKDVTESSRQNKVERGKERQRGGRETERTDNFNSVGNPPTHSTSSVNIYVDYEMEDAALPSAFLLSHCNMTVSTHKYKPSA